MVRERRGVEAACCRGARSVARPASPRAETPPPATDAAPPPPPAPGGPPSKPSVGTTIQIELALSTDARTLALIDFTSFLAHYMRNQSPTHPQLLGRSRRISGLCGCWQWTFLVVVQWTEQRMHFFAAFGCHPWWLSWLERLTVTSQKASEGRWFEPIPGRHFCTFPSLLLADSDFGSD